MEPTGELVIQTIAMPADTNANGDIFGGWLLAQMDMGGAVLAYQLAGRIATRGIDDMNFVKPVKVGDRVACHASLEKKGRTSLGIRVEAWAFHLHSGVSELVAYGLYTYVSIDKAGRPIPIQVPE